MERQSFFCFTIQGNGLDVIVAKEQIGLPCNIFLKGEKTFTKILKKEVISRSTRWIYHAESIEQTNTIQKTNAFLEKHLQIIVNKMPVLESYIKNFKTLLDIVIYEDREGKDTIVLSKKTIKLLNKIGIEFSISFK